ILRLRRPFLPQPLQPNHRVTAGRQLLPRGGAFMNVSFASSRRQFLKIGAAGAAGAVLPGWTIAKGAPAIIAAESEPPQLRQGRTLGDPGNGSGAVWSRSDRAARMLVDWSYDEQFTSVQRLVGPHALETTD